MVQYCTPHLLAKTSHTALIAEVIRGTAGESVRIASKYDSSTVVEYYAMHRLWWPPYSPAKKNTFYKTVVFFAWLRTRLP